MRWPVVLRELSPGGQLFLLLLLLLVCGIFSVSLAYFISLIIWGSATILVPAADEASNLNFVRFFQMANQVGIFLLPPVLLAMLTEAHPSAFLKNTRPRPLHLLLAMLMILTAGPFINLLISWNEAMRLPEFLAGLEHWMRNAEESAARLTNRFLTATGTFDLIVNVVMIGLLPAIGEELLFRSALIGILRKFFKQVHWPVILSSLIFSAFHLQFFGFLPRFVLGLGLGYLFVWSGSVWVPVLAHFVNNITVVLISYLYQHNLISTGIETFGQTSSPFLLTASVILPALTLFLVYRSGKITIKDTAQG